MVPGVAVALTVGMAFTVMVMVLDVAGLPVAHVSLEVSTQVTLFPFASVEEVYVVLLLPTFTPLSFHW
jgi:hypothetical protein